MLPVSKEEVSQKRLGELSKNQTRSQTSVACSPFESRGAHQSDVLEARKRNLH
jgi:hypothetical protein